MKRSGTTARLLATASLAALLLSGCAGWRGARIDPTGQSVFVVDSAAPMVPAAPPASGPCPPSGAVCISPYTLVAPVGTEVVLVAAVRSREDFLLTNERVEWSIAPCGAGQFLDVSTNVFTDLLFGQFERGRVSPTFAVSTTSRSSFTLHRGTPNPADDIPILAGQAWVSLTSPVPGISHVTAYAPNVVGWQTNKHMATIQWVDPRQPLALAPQSVAPQAIPQAAPVPITTSPAPVAAPIPVTPAPATTPPTLPQGRPVLEVTIQGPNQANVGSSVSFQVIVTNRGTVTASNLVIRDRFDPGLEHARAKSVIEGELLKSIGPGERQAITIDFRVASAGRLCHTAEVRDRSGTLASSQACLIATESRPVSPPSTAPQITPPPGASQPSTPPLPVIPPTTSPPVTQPPPATAPTPLSVQVTSPATATVGETPAPLTIRVTNTTGRRLSQVKISARVDPAWTPKEASQGLRMEGDSLTWTFTLEPSAFIIRDIVCQAAKPSARACIRASVTSLEGSSGSGEACTEIREPAKPSPSPSGPTAPPELKVTAASLRNPVAEGREFTYEALVTNTGASAATQVVLIAAIPNGMAPINFGTTGPTQPTIEGQTLRFEPVATLPPGQTLTYRIRVRSQQSGDFRFHVEATTRGASSPFTADATTQVFKAQ